MTNSFPEGGGAKKAHCPFCGVKVLTFVERDPNWGRHPKGDCILAGRSMDLSLWLRRPTPPSGEAKITDPRPDIVGDPLCKIISYNECHEDAVAMGYPSLTEALEHLSELQEASRTLTGPIRDWRGGGDRARELLADALEDRGYATEAGYVRAGEADFDLVDTKAALRAIERSLQQQSRATGGEGAP